MNARKNIFLISRKGHERDENQLTEMLAYLFQEERALVPDVGRAPSAASLVRFRLRPRA